MLGKRLIDVSMLMILKTSWSATHTQCLKKANVKLWNLHSIFLFYVPALIICLNSNHIQYKYSKSRLNFIKCYPCAPITQKIVYKVVFDVKLLEGMSLLTSLYSIKTQ